MIQAQKTKAVLVTPPAAINDNAAAATAIIDTLGWDYLEIYVLIGATDIATAAMKVQESDDSGMSGAADIVGLRPGTDTDAFGAASALPTANDDNTIQKFGINLLGRKRYIDLLLTGGDGSAGTYYAVLAVLSRGKEDPNTAAKMGCDLVMRA